MYNKTKQKFIQKYKEAIIQRWSDANDVLLAFNVSGEGERAPLNLGRWQAI
jgi:hypothetical protein